MVSSSRRRSDRSTSAPTGAALRIGSIAAVVTSPRSTARPDGCSTSREPRGLRDVSRRRQHLAGEPPVAAVLERQREGGARPGGARPLDDTAGAGAGMISRLLSVLVTRRILPPRLTRSARIPGGPGKGACLGVEVRLRRMERSVFDLTQDSGVGHRLAARPDSAEGCSPEVLGPTSADSRPWPVTAAHPRGSPSARAASRSRSPSAVSPSRASKYIARDDRPAAREGRRADPSRGARRHGDDARRRPLPARLPRLQHDLEPAGPGRPGRVLPQRVRAPRARRPVRRRAGCPRARILPRPGSARPSSPSSPGTSRSTPSTCSGSIVLAPACGSAARRPPGRSPHRYVWPAGAVASWRASPAWARVAVGGLVGAPFDEESTSHVSIYYAARTADGCRPRRATLAAETARCRSGGRRR